VMTSSSRAVHRSAPYIAPRLARRGRGNVATTAGAAAAENVLSTPQLKTQILQLASLTDRGQRHNRVVSGAYEAEEKRMQSLLDELCAKPHTLTEEAVSGEWELVYAQVELFRSSPFFLAVEEALGTRWKSDLFFRLHQLQVLSWGASTVGRVAQRIDFEAREFESEFDTILFGLTVIPIVGWFKLLPTFGGTVITVAKDLRLEGDTMTMELEKTRVIPTAGVHKGLLGKLLMERWAPVNAVWKLLPWNWGGAPTCSVSIKYVDDEFRIAEDKYGQLFVYMRPIL